MALLTGGEVIVEILKAEGVKFVFGLPGGHTLPIYDGLYHNPQQIRHILVRHEQQAANMAAAYASLTGEPGVCCATCRTRRHQHRLRHCRGLLRRPAGHHPDRQSSDTDHVQGRRPGDRPGKVIRPHHQMVCPGGKNGHAAGDYAPRLCSGPFRQAGPGAD